MIRKWVGLTFARLHHHCLGSFVRILAAALVAVILPAQTTVAPSRIEKPDQIAKLSTGNAGLV
jgi:hypothetical protein